MAAALDPERLRRARAYRAFRLRLSIVEEAVRVLVLGAVTLSGVTATLRDATPRAFAGDYAVVGAVIAGLWVAGLPLDYAAYRRGRAEGLVVQGLPSAAGDALKGLVLGLLLFGAPLAAWYSVLPRPDWWVFTIAGVAALSLLGFALSPLLAALFFRFERLGDQDLRARILALASRLGVRVSDVYRWRLSEKATTANAAVTGLGPTKRIVIADTLLDRFPVEQVEAVIAHEIAHEVHRDTLRVLLFSVAGGSALLIALRFAVDALTGGHVTDVATYPLLSLLLTLALFVTLPIFLAHSRSREYAADAYAARHAGARPMSAALVRLADQNLSDPEPPAWEEVLFMTHPSVRNRVRALGEAWPQ